MNREILRTRVLESVDITKEVSDDEVLEVIEDTLCEMSRISYIPLKERGEAAREVYHSLRKLDVLQDLLEDPAVTEIMINGPDHIFVEKYGRVLPCERHFTSREKLEDVIQQIVAGANRMVNESVPIADARLSDGSRVNVVLAPVALNGPAVTIRRFPERPMQVNDLKQLGALDDEIAEFLRVLVEARYNIFISGGTGSGKTTFLNVLSGFIPPDERIITIEDTAELQITGIVNQVRMETRNANVEGCKEITIRDLIRTSLRMRPDRILVGEIRGGEAVDLLQAYNTGHDGSISTGHANSPRDMMSRLETMVLMGIELPLQAVQRQIASGIDILIHLGRLRDKSRKLLSIAEVSGYGGEGVSLHMLFEFVETGEGRDGKVEGVFQKKGELQDREKLERKGYRL